MLNVYWKTPSQTRGLLPKPFGTESELEGYIYKNRDLLPDIFILYRQVRTGSRQGIPDMLGVDQDSRICIIEIKNVTVGEDILPQVLSYAMWAETNPDSIKAIWLESKSQPEDVQIDWDSLEIRIIVVAPSFRPTVPRMAAKIGYPVDLVELERFSLDDDEFVLVELLDKLAQPKPTTTKTMGEWDWEFYSREHGDQATGQFRQSVVDLAKFVNAKGWALPYNLNKYYTGFKLGNRVVFSVSWGGTRAWKVHIKVPEEAALGFSTANWEFQRYDRQFSEAIFRVKPDGTADVEELEPLLAAAYRQISGVN